MLIYTNAAGVETQYSYDTFNGNTTSLVNRTRINVSGENIDIYYTYDFQQSLLLSEEDPLGKITNYTYDDIGRLINVIYPTIDNSRPVRTYEYDDMNLTIYIMNEEGYVESKTEYDPLGRAAFISRLNATNATYSYDAQHYYDFEDRIKKVWDDNYNAITTDYDFLGRKVKITNADNTYQTIAYDDKEHSVMTEDEMGNKIERIYDIVGNLINVREYINDIAYYETNCTYNDAGELKTITDALNQTTTYYYDNLGRRINITYPDATFKMITYDNLGQIIDIIKPDGNHTKFSYDELGQKKRVIYSQNEWINYTYDKCGNILAALYKRDPVTVNTWRDYDAGNRILNDTTAIAGDNSYNYTVSYEYDNRSLITNIDWEEDDISYEYDEFGRVTEVYNSLYTYAEYNYNTLDMIINITYYNGVVTEFTYDSQRYWLEKILTKDDGQDTMMELNYTYDDSGMITNINGETYEYDALGRLINCYGPWGTINYTYDAVGNRLQQKHGITWTNYSYGSYNRLLWVNSTSNVNYEYDSAGRLTVKNDDYWEYEYDYSEKLIEVQKDNSTVAEFVYDAFGRRIKVTEGSTTYFVYDDQSPVLEKNNKEYNYFYGNGQIVCKFEAFNKHWYYYQDLLGSIRIVTDKDGNPVFQSNYEPFGIPNGASGSSTFTYTGAPKDSSTGLYYLQTRYLNPLIGRFTQMDSWTGEIKSPKTMIRYVYCANNPILNSDPSGMYYSEPGIFIGGGRSYIEAGFCTISPSPPLLPKPQPTPTPEIIIINEKYFEDRGWNMYPVITLKPGYGGITWESGIYGILEKRSTIKFWGMTIGYIYDIYYHALVGVGVSKTLLAVQLGEIPLQISGGVYWGSSPNAGGFAIGMGPILGMGVSQEGDITGFMLEPSLKFTSVGYMTYLFTETRIASIFTGVLGIPIGISF